MNLYSIILPTFNRRALITRAIDSVILQSYSRWELIIIDDGSSDDTKSIVQSYLNDDRIKYIYQKNQERSVARNNGIKIANGKYICFLDSDDKYHSSHIEEFEKLIIKHNSQQGLYISGVSFEKYDNTNQKYVETENGLDFVIINSIGTPRTCISREILKNHKFNPNIRIGEDKELWVRIAKKHPIFYHFNKTFIEIDHPDRSIKKNLYEHLDTLNLIFSKLSKKEYSGVLRKKVISAAYFNIAKHELLRNKKIKSIYFILRSICINIINEQTKFKINIAFQIITFNLKKLKKLLDK